MACGCGSSPALSVFAGRAFGDGEEAVAGQIAAATAAPALSSLFLVSVAAGVTVYVITMFLPRRK